MTARQVDVILPAGGRLAGEFAAEAATDVKALIRIGGETILERTIRTLRASGAARRIVVVAPHELALHPAARQADTVIPEGASGPENILRGLDWLRAEGEDTDRVLVMTTDLPFAGTDCINAFLAACPDDAAVAVPILRANQFRRRFPGSPATFACLNDGEWTMGCAFLLDPHAVRRNITNIRRVFDARKSETSMARLLGPLFVLRYLAKRLTVADIERRCSRILGCRGVAVPNAPPELAADIDTLEEYRYAVAAIQPAFN